MEKKRFRTLSILIFCVCFLALELSLIVRAHFVPDKRFGFWMFAEASYYSATLFLKLKNGRYLRTKNGVWEIYRSENDSEPTVYSWDGFVKDFRLFNLERTKRAKTGMHVTLKYLEDALNFVADKIEEDNATEKLILVVRYQKADGIKRHVFLESKARKLA